ncbi:hypothetical protein GGER_51400 [Serratia rubidaea]
MRMNVFDGFQVPFGQIHHMDVITHAGAVRCGIVVAEYRQLFQFSNGHLSDIGHKVVGDATWVLTNQPRWMGAYRVEVT